MSLPDQIAAYEDCFDLYSSALADSIGVRARFPNHVDAKLMQMRMHQARSLQRRESIRLYDKTDLRWNKSEFDPLKVSVRVDDEDRWWVYVIRHGQEIETIEPLSTVSAEVHRPPKLEISPPRLMIEALEPGTTIKRRF